MDLRPDQAALAEQFLTLHRAHKPFVLGNAWDVVTALLFEREGFKAIGTTSYATAATLGLHDGQQFPLSETVVLVQRLTHRLNIPVSADIEAGYADTVEGVVESARAVLKAGAVGINLEDSTGDPERPLFDVSSQCKKIASIRAMANETGIHLVINARTDAVLLNGNAHMHLDHAIERGLAYVSAGADCVFVPDMGDLNAASMKRLVQEIGAPINIIAGASTPPMRELEDVGIARVSFGPRAMRAALGLYQRIAREIQDEGTFATLFSGALSYEATNQLLVDGTAPRLSSRNH